MHGQGVSRAVRTAARRPGPRRQPPRPAPRRGRLREDHPRAVARRLGRPPGPHAADGRTSTRPHPLRPAAAHAHPPRRTAARPRDFLAAAAARSAGRAAPRLGGPRPDGRRGACSWSTASTRSPTPNASGPAAGCGDLIDTYDGTTAGSSPPAPPPWAADWLAEEDFAELTLAAMGPADIATFIERWHDGRPDGAARRRGTRQVRDPAARRRADQARPRPPGHQPPDVRTDLRPPPGPARLSPARPQGPLRGRAVHAAQPPRPRAGHDRSPTCARSRSSTSSSGSRTG